MLTEAGGSEPKTLIGAAWRYANDQAPIVVLAFAAVGFMAWLYVSTLQGMSQDLHIHIRESGRYQYQSCLSLAVLAGTHPELCAAEDNSHGSR